MIPDIADWASDYPECPHCGEDVNIHKVDNALYRCGGCDEIYPDLSFLPILAGVDLEDQLPKRHKKNKKRSKNESRQDTEKRPVAPVLGSLDREEQGLVDLTGLYTDFSGDDEQSSDYGISW